MPSTIRNKKLDSRIREVADLCKPDSIYWCNGSQGEYDRLMSQMVTSGMAIPLKQRPQSFLFRSDPSEVARTEDRTYIASSSQGEAGPTNNWIDPNQLKETMKGLYAGCMKGRTLYVIPFSMGPIGSPISPSLNINGRAYRKFMRVSNSVLWKIESSMSAKQRA